MRLRIRFSSVVKQFDVFGVGGGGGGGMGANGSRNYPTSGGSYDIGVYGFGGGGGYTQTVLAVSNTEEEIAITVGRAGSGGSDDFPDDPEWDDRNIKANGSAGGSTSVLLGSTSLISVSGGQGGSGGYNSIRSGQSMTMNETPANGGSGGGNLDYIWGGTWSNNIPGGEDGGNGGGVGQGTTTREFGEEAGTLYASGGGTAIAVINRNRVRLGRNNAGGEGAGDGLYTHDSVRPTENLTYFRGNNATIYGSGGGGVACGMVDPDYDGRLYIVGGNGASGIVIFRWTV